MDILCSVELLCCRRLIIKFTQTIKGCLNISIVNLTVTRSPHSKLIYPGKYGLIDYMSATRIHDLNKTTQMKPHDIL